ncbi:GTP cyclohydrolase II RibA [Frigidibacter sp. MR17.24]|uniref:GTP cyclohydrolase II RibA n=1 Tax=Frigidibacter sp. MR17.24 TaxID=3127345 RepID=UPI003012F12A
MTVHDLFHRPDADRGAALAGMFLTPATRCERAVSELRHGRPVILHDDAGTLAVMALDAASPRQLAQMAAASAGRHWLFLTAERMRRLGARAEGGAAVPMAGRDFDAASRLAYLPGESLPADWRPAPAAATAAAELANLGLLLPAMVCTELPRGPAAFAGCLEIDGADLAAMAAERQRFEIVVRTPVPLRDLGMCDFVVFRGGVSQKDQVAIVVGTPDLSGPVPVRIHSSCLTGDLSGSLKCDCGDQLRGGLKALAAAGGGVLLYLDQEGRGTGIGAKMRAYGYQHAGHDTIDADAELGFGPDHRRYEAAVAMLRLLGIATVDLHTNNPTKIAALAGSGLTVAGRTAVTGRITAENAEYLRTKSARAGHMLDCLPGLSSAFVAGR